MTQPGDVRVRRALLSVSDKRGIADFARGLAELGDRARLDRRHRARAAARPGSRSARSRTSPASPRSWAAASRRCTRSSTPACSRCATTPSTWSPPSEHGDRVRRPRLREPLPVRAHRRPARRDRPRGDREHRHRRPDDDPRGGEELRLHRRRHAARDVRRGAAGARATPTGRLSLGTRESLAAEAFSYTARYDTAIARWFAEKQEDFPPLLMSAYEKVTDLAYGENPHQRAAYYAQVGARMHVLSMVRQVAGKDLSFNNVLDLNSGRLLVEEFNVPACAIIKHNNPCGAAIGSSGARGLRARVRVRPAVGVRRRRLPQPAGRPRARRAARRSSSARSCSRPRYTDDALELLEAKPNMRILEDNERRRFNIAERDLKRVMGGLLVQDRDIDLEDRSEMEVVTERKPSEAEWGEMLFGWKVCKHVRSNAIVLVARARVGRHRRRADEPRRLRAARDREGARRRRATCRARRSPQTRSSRSPTGRSSRSRPASRRSSSRAAPSATSRSSRPPTPRGSAWSSRTAATSSTDAVARLVAPEARQQRAQRDRARRRTTTPPAAIENGTLVTDATAPRAGRAERRPDRVGELLDPGQPAAHVVGDRLVPQRLAEDRRGHVRRAGRGERDERERQRRRRARTRRSRAPYAPALSAIALPVAAHPRRPSRSTSVSSSRADRPAAYSSPSSSGPP